MGGERVAACTNGLAMDDAQVTPASSDSSPSIRVLFSCTGVGVFNRGIESFFREAFDGLRGLAEAAPFDGIIMTAVTTHIPTTLLDQLMVGGRMVFPKGTQKQNLCIIERNSQGYTETVLEEVNFVPLLAGVVKK